MLTKYAFDRNDAKWESSLPREHRGFGRILDIMWTVIYVTFNCVATLGRIRGGFVKRMALLAGSLGWPVIPFCDRSERVDTEEDSRDVQKAV